MNFKNRKLYYKLRNVKYIFKSYNLKIHKYILDYAI